MDTLGSEQPSASQAAAWRRNLAAITIAQALAIIGFTLRESFLPFYVQSLGAESTDASAIWSGLIVAGGAGVMALSAPFWGVIADRRGRKPMLLRAMFGALITVGLMGLAAAPWHLLALRFLEGALTGTVTASTALVASSAPKDRLGFSLGLVQTSVFSGASLGPFLGGLLAEQIGYRATFAVAGALLGSAGLIVLFLVTEEFTPAARGSERGLRAFRASARMLLGPVLLAMVAVLFVVRFTQMSTRPILPLYVEQVGDFAGAGSDERAASLAGVALGLLGLTSAAASVLLGRHGDRVGHRRILFASLLGAGLLYLPMAAVSGAWQLVGLQALYGVAAGGLIPSANAIIAEATPRDRRGTTFGLTAAAASLGAMFGPLAGSGIAAAAGLRAAFIATAALLLVATAWVAYLLPRALAVKPDDAAPAATATLEQSGAR